MTGLFGAAGEVQEFCARSGWRFCLIGGLALQRGGGPRYSQGVDLNIFTGFGNEVRFVDVVLASHKAQIFETRELLRTSAGVPLDFNAIT